MLANAAFEVAFVAIGHAFERVAVYHDYRWIHAALVGIAQFGAIHAAALGRLRLYRFVNQARQRRSRHFAVGRLVRLDDRIPQRRKPLSLFGRDVVLLGKLQKTQARFGRTQQHFTLVAVYCIPLIDGNYHGATRFENEACNVRILIGYALGRVDQQQYHMGRFNGLQSFDDTEFFDGFKNLALAAQAGGIDQLELLPLAHKGHADGITCGAGQIERNQALFPQPGVDEGGFTRIGAAHHSQANGVGRFCVVCGFFWFLHMDGIKRQLQQIVNALAVGGRDTEHLAQAQLVKLGQLLAIGHAFGFVGYQNAGFAQAAQVVGNVVVLRRQATAGIDDKNHHIGFGHGLAGLVRHFAIDAAFACIGLKPTRVDDDEFAATRAP